MTCFRPILLFGACLALGTAWAAAPPARAPRPSPSAQAALDRDTLPKDAALSNGALLLRFHADEKGLRLTSLGNLLTSREYLRATFTAADAEGLPPPALWEGRAPGVTPPPETLPEGAGTTDVSRIGNPFYIIANRGDHTETFHAAADFDVLSVRANPRSVTVRLRGRGLLLEAQLRVTLSADRSFWTLALHNLSGEPLQASVGFPAFARLMVDGPRRDRVIVPWGSGAVLRDPVNVKWRADYGAGWSAPFALWSGRAEGLYLVDTNRADSLGVPSATVRRALVVGPEEGLPADSGPSLAMAQSVRLEPGGDATLGPVALGVYRGDLNAGVGELARARGRAVPMPRSTGDLAAAPMVARHDGDLTAFTADALPRGWKLVLLSGFSDPDIGNYATIPDSMGGRAGLRAAVKALHDAGGKVLLTLDGGRLSKNAAIGRVSGEAWAVRGFNGKPVEENGNWVMCPANPDWRDWLTKTAVRLIRLYGADGVAITGLAGEPYQVCISRNHAHATPYAWTWGIRRLFGDLRTQLTQELPGALLVSVGALDIAREYVDAMVADTHAVTGYRFEYPLLRAVYPAIRVYEAASAPDHETAERLLAWNVGEGLPLYAPTLKAAKEGPLAPTALFDAFPDVMDGAAWPAPVATSSREVVGAVRVGRSVVLTLGNTGDEVFTGVVRLPFAAAALENPTTGLRIEPNAAGEFAVALQPLQNAFWTVLTTLPPE